MQAITTSERAASISVHALGLAGTWSSSVPGRYSSRTPSGVRATMPSISVVSDSDRP